MPTQPPIKRSLMLAGGGLKVAFQAGVLQVWLDEAGVQFDHVDGASGGVFNLAMLCQGMSGQQIADNWRNLPPAFTIDFNWSEYLKTIYARSLLTLNTFREQALPHWGIDWQQIRASSLDATFNVYNFSRHELEVLSPAQMSEDFLMACVSLPMWFPPVEINGQTYIDPVFVTDANIEEAIARGADEIWVIWTVSTQSEWHNGLIANYFQIVETSANGQFRRMQQRITANNQAIAAGQRGEFGRHIELKVLDAEVPIHYLINVSNDRLREAVERGVAEARAWCRRNGRPLGAPAEYTSSDLTVLRFHEEMRGFFTLGEDNPERGATEGERAATPIAVELDITIDGVQRFVADPDHQGLIKGVVRCDLLGGELPIERGWFNLLVDEDDPRTKKMGYRLLFRRKDGAPLTLIGMKQVRNDPGFDSWSDTTTLYVRLHEAHLAPDGGTSAVVAAGVVAIDPLDLLAMLASFRVEGPDAASRMAALRDFGAFFLGRLWDVYARRVLPYAPF